ncbi:MAG: DUF6057 family protein [Prevotella sp.]
MKISIANRKTISTLPLYGSFVAFVAFAIYVLYINQDVLYTAHERSEFLYGSTFLKRVMSQPFGAIRYAGGWLTQFFFHPALGSAMLGGLWLLVVVVGIKAFRLKGASTALMLLPVACLLASVVDLGYWIYFLPIRGYWFSQSLGLLLMLLLLWVARSTPRRWHAVWYLFGFFLYPVLGWFSMLFVVCLAFMGKPSWREVVCILVLLFTASIWHNLVYSNMRSEDVAMAGFPRFVTPSDVNTRLSVPFWIMGAVIVLIPLFVRFLANWLVPVLCAIAGIVITSSFMFTDKNYIYEMRMTRSAEANDWKEVVALAEKAQRPTSSMLMLKNIALMHEGTLLERSFPMGNETFGMHNPDSVHVSFLEIAAPVTYYNYGMLNEAFRLSFECAVQAGFSPAYLKMLARSAHANGEDNLAQRYIAQLHRHPFYRDWQPEKVSEKIRELHNAYPDEITGVESSDGYIVTSLSLWYESDSKLASEQALFYSMMRRDSKRFWASFRKFVKTHMGEEFPVPVAEAYIMYMDKAPEKKRVMIPINKDLYERYKQFWASLEQLARSGMTREAIAEKMRLQYGDTYWYYNVFSRRVY